jgi:hypothetical protein
MVFSFRFDDDWKFFLVILNDDGVVDELNLLLRRRKALKFQKNFPIELINQ